MVPLAKKHLRAGDSSSGRPWQPRGVGQLIPGAQGSRSVGLSPLAPWLGSSAGPISAVWCLYVAEARQAVVVLGRVGACHACLCESSKQLRSLLEAKYHQRGRVESIQ